MGAIVCFLMRMAGLRYGIGLPRADMVAVTGIRPPRRTDTVEPEAGEQQPAPHGGSPR